MCNPEFAAQCFDYAVTTGKGFLVWVHPAFNAIRASLSKDVAAKISMACNGDVVRLLYTIETCIMRPNIDLHRRSDCLPQSLESATRQTQFEQTNARLDRIEKELAAAARRHADGTPPPMWDSGVAAPCFHSGVASPCFQFERSGKCAKGDLCPYGHKPHQLGNPSSKTHTAIPTSNLGADLQVSVYCEYHDSYKHDATVCDRYTRHLRQTALQETSALKCIYHPGLANPHPTDACRLDPASKAKALVKMERQRNPSKKQPADSESVCITRMLSLIHI